MSGVKKGTRSFAARLVRLLNPSVYTGRRRLGSLAAIGLIIGTIAAPVVNYLVTAQRYVLAADERVLVGSANPNLAGKITYDASRQMYQFNKDGLRSGDQSPAAKLRAQVGGVGKKSPNLYSVNLPVDASKGFTYYDNNLELSFSLVPQFATLGGKNKQGQLVYPLKDVAANAVFTAKGNGLKEDIVLEHAPSGGTFTASYKLNLPQELQARVIAGTGSIGIYSADPALFGSITFGGDTDEEKVMSARKNGQKTNLVFVLPAPVVKQSGRKGGKVKASFSLSNNILTVSATGLNMATYPITIDPSVVVTSNSDFGTGNNEGDIDYDLTNQQIDRGGLTGGSVRGGFSTSSALPETIYGGSAVVYNGYIYVLGGYDGTAPGPVTFNSSGTYTVPSGVTSIAITAQGGSGGTVNTTTGGLGGIATLNSVSVTPGETLYVNVGGQGANGASCGASSSGGANGGGNGGTVFGTCTSGAWSAGGGGGASDVRQGGSALANRIIVGGGGGGAGYTSPGGGALGGVGGGTSGGGGAGLNGGGGTQSGGGAAGSSACSQGPGAGSLGLGGAGGGKTTSSGGGGGGGGYYGGGGGSCTTGNITAPGSGGGGSGYPATATFSTASSAGAGQVTITPSGGTAPGALNTVYYALICTGSNSGTGGCSSTAGTIGTWSLTTSFTTARQAPGAIAYNGYMYVMGGTGGSLLNDVQYAPISTSTGAIGAWSSTSSFNIARDGFGAAVYNGYLYILGGFHSTLDTACNTASNTACDDVQYAPVNADGTLGSWQYTAGGSSCATFAGTCSSATFTNGRQSLASVVYNGYIYITGGTGNSTTYNDVQYAPINSNGTIGSWNVTTSFTTARRAHTASVYDGYIYIMGGTSGSDLNDVQYAPINSNGTIGNWSTTSTFATARDSHMSVSYLGYVYILGGQHATSDTLCNSIASFGCSDTQYAKIDTAGMTGPFATTTSIPTNAVKGTRYGRQHFGAVAYNGYLYISGGYYNSLSKFLSDVQYAPISSNGTIGTWTATTSMPTTLNAHTMLAYNGYMYIVGGETGSGGTNSFAVDYATIASNGTLGSWTATSSLNTNLAVPVATIYNGYMYATGGRDLTNNSWSGSVQYAQINSNGTLQPWAATNGFSEGRIYHVAAAYNGYLYVWGGQVGNNLLDSTVEYTQINSNGTTSASWSFTNSMNDARQEFGGFIYNGCLYASGGVGVGSGVTLATTEFACINSNGSIQSWTYAPSFTNGRSGNQDVVFNGYHYVIAGVQGFGSFAEYSDVQYAAINNGGPGTVSSWTNGFSLATTSNPGAVAYNGYVYAADDSNSTIYYGKISYNGPIAAWTSTNSPPYAVSRQLLAYNGYLYLFTGQATQSNFIYYAQIQSDGSVGTWTATSGYSGARNNESTAIYNGYMYVVGGYNTGTSTYLQDIQYSQIGSNGTLGTWASTTNLPGALRGQASVAANGYLYVLGGTNGTDTNAVISVPLNSNGTLGSTWLTTNSLNTARELHTAFALNGYIYVLGGMLSNVSLNDVQIAAIGPSGTVEGWSSTTAFATARHYQATAVGNGFVYVMGGQHDTSDTACNGTASFGCSDVQYASINSIPRGGTYSKLIDLGSANTLNSLTYTGTVPNGLNAFTVRAAGSNAVFGSNLAASAINNTCARYAWVSVDMDDSQAGAVFPDATGSNNANVQDFTLNYTAISSGSGVPVDRRLFGGKYFDATTQILQPLDTNKSSGGGGGGGC